MVVVSIEGEFPCRPLAHYIVDNSGLDVSTWELTLTDIVSE